MRNPTLETNEVRIGPEGNGELVVPTEAESLVVLVHGSGSSRLNPRNREMARVFQKAGMATLLSDLLTQDEELEEEFTLHYRFDIPFLTRRLNQMLDWVKSQDHVPSDCIGLLGSDTAAAAALQVAAQRGEEIRSVVCQGGRPDLAGPALLRVDCPVLLIVGSCDNGVVELNERVAKEMRQAHLTLIPNASHLFPEPGALLQVSKAACHWFERYLSPDIYGEEV